METADLEQIVLTVRREYDRLRGGRKRFRISAFHRVAFLLLRIAAFSIPVALALLLLLIFFGQGGGTPALLLLVWFFLAGVLLLPLTLLNLPLIVAAWQQRRPIVKRDLLVGALPVWQRKARWVVLGLTAAAAILAAAFEPFGWGGFSLVLVVVVFPFLLLVLQSFLGLAQRNLGLLRSVEELLGVLEEQLAEARREELAHVELSHEVAVNLANTTTGLVGIERLRAIDDALREPTAQYSVSQSTAFREQLQAFEPAVRLAILDRVQLLGASREPEGSRLGAARGRRIWSLGEPAVEVVYEIADDRRQVLIHDARPAESGGGSGKNGPG